jgi:hypothetical protein
MTTTPTLIRVEDHEGDGRCGHCGRENLRWIAILSDGNHVGLTCANRIFGWKLAAADFSWVADFEMVAEHTEHSVVWALWKHKTRNATRQTRNGHLDMVGGARAEWTRNGWL